ncbi:hypothetical protein B0H67DRAFT_575946 [Lasiosphaeris hirsuta]|uniref:Uncharacterized protein n=1 Tax=Lasiosphaeris hirsuta TaxID=260670 RepID=A0AA40E2M5_9PEZI|nr:hypothetical protein B0H67DRAFT_575946 [Lasiosphaeris hirsuta]
MQSVLDLGRAVSTIGRAAFVFAACLKCLPLPCPFHMVRTPYWQRTKHSHETFRLMTLSRCVRDGRRTLPGLSHLVPASWEGKEKKRRDRNRQSRDRQSPMAAQHRLGHGERERETGPPWFRDLLFTCPFARCAHTHVFQGSQLRWLQNTPCKIPCIRDLGRHRHGGGEDRTCTWRNMLVMTAISSSVNIRPRHAVDLVPHPRP